MNNSPTLLLNENLYTRDACKKSGNFFTVMSYLEIFHSPFFFIMQIHEAVDMFYEFADEKTCSKYIRQSYQRFFYGHYKK